MTARPQRTGAWRRFQRLNVRVYNALNRIRLGVRHRLGYRGLILFMFGLIYICIGLSVINANDYTPELVHTHLPVWFRVLLWTVPGVVAVLVSVDNKWQSLGFALLFLPPSERAVSYAIAVVSVPTWTRVPAVLIYLIIMLTVVFIASWPEPTETQKAVRDRADGALLRPQTLHMPDGRDIAVPEPEHQDRDGGVKA